MKIRIVRKDYKDEDNPYWLSFSDVMSGLLMIFILACVSLLLQLQQQRLVWENKNKILQQKIDVEENIKKDIQADLFQVKEDLSKYFIFVELDGDTIHIPTDEINFETDQDRVLEEKIKSVELIGKSIFSLVEKNKDKIDTVFIEGHTDQRTSYRRNGNWGLSVDRAIFVWNTWQKALCQTEFNCNNFKNKDGKPIFSVSGYADTRPILGTKNRLDAESLKKNRRIDIRFVARKANPNEFLENKNE